MIVHLYPISLFVSSNKSIFNNSYQIRRLLSLVRMTTEPKWRVEKNKILNLPIVEKRKLYKFSDYITLESVNTWVKYYENVSNSNAISNSVDAAEFKKININSEMNKSLAGKVSIFKGDITKLEIDAIVNAANTRLKAGGGVDGAIHRAAGPLLQEECNMLGGCPTGDAKVTGGYNLPAKYVIHTVGPQDGSASKLESCYKKCLSYQQEYDIKSIAFPCISTGIYGFPNRLAAHIALRSARQFLENKDSMERIIFCTFMPIDADIYETLMELYFPIN